MDACRHHLENLFQPLTDALAYHDAVSDSEDLLDSSYSADLSPRPSSASAATPSKPQDTPQTDPQTNPQTNPQTLPQPNSQSGNQPLASSASNPTLNPRSDPSSGATPSNSNGNGHAVTSAHHSAATIAESAQQAAAAEAREVKLEGLLEVYEEPDSHAGLYNYAKALEDVEAGLLAGFFYKHFCLASNVIGSESKGEKLSLPAGLLSKGPRQSETTSGPP